MEKNHPSVVEILNQATDYRMDRLSLASAICKKYDMAINYGYEFIQNAEKDHIIRSIYSGINCTIELDEKYRHPPAGLISGKQTS
jgi:hypothetical protein